MQYSDNFEWVWMRRPRRDGGDSKANAYRKWSASIKKGYTEREMASGLIRYAKWCKARGKEGTAFVMRMETFFGPGEHFTELWEVRQPETASTKARSVQDGLDDRSWAYGSVQPTVDASWAIGVDS